MQTRSIVEIVSRKTLQTSLMRHLKLCGYSKKQFFVTSMLRINSFGTRYTKQTVSYFDVCLQQSLSFERFASLTAASFQSPQTPILAAHANTRS